jgi:hypothetical protein
MGTDSSQLPATDLWAVSSLIAMVGRTAGSPKHQACCLWVAREENGLEIQQKEAREGGSQCFIRGTGCSSEQLLSGAPTS